jgi:hypothetical protein
MAPLAVAGILGGAGLLKGIGPDKWKEDRQRWLASQTQRYSPWTGLKAGPVDEADPFGSTLQGGMSGFSMGQNMQAAARADKLMDAQTNYLNRAPGGYIGMEPMATQQAFELEQAQLPRYARKNPWSF